MRRPLTYLVVAAVVGALGVAGTMVARADWAIPSKPVSFRVRSEKMPRGVTPSVAKQGGGALVSWSAQEIAPGDRMDRYVVTAHSVSEPPLPDVTHTVTAGGGASESVTFAAAEVAGGKWYWTIVPKYRLWVGEESGRSDRLAFPGAPAVRSAGANPATEAAVAGPAAPPATPPAATTAPATAAPADTPHATPAETRSASPEATPIPVATGSDESAPTVAPG
ncbi:hypothetical protein ACQP2F_42070 [Actinoplanes sp. CA-030573]|uniref:hypothetical protein n=1 Tax=Actinoplanes sp. CA-030573 TaxID=3239898 RepID=UPI003D92A8E0